MRLLYVIHSFPPESRGGSEIACRRVAEWMLAQGHEVHVLTRVGEPESEYGAVTVRDQDGLSVHRINRTYDRIGKFRDVYEDPDVERYFERLLDEVQPDLVHFHHLTHLSVQLPTIAKRRGIAVVFTLHDYWLFCQLGQLLTHDFKRCEGPKPGRCLRCNADQLVPAEMVSPVRNGKFPGFKNVKKYLDARGNMKERLDRARDQWSNVDLFVSSSDYLRDWFIKVGVAPQKIVTIDNGYPLDQFEGIDPPRAEKPLRFGYVGNLIPSKGIHVLVDAFREVQGTAELQIHGDYTIFHGGFEDYTERLRERADGDSRIVFKGAYEPERVREVMSRVDVVIVPSIWYENSPLTIHESFLAGRPVITSNIGGMEELVTHEKNGLLFEIGNAKDLARQIQRFVDDPTLTQRLQTGGVVLSNDDVGQQLADIYSRFVTVAV